MITIFNRKELTITYAMKEQARVRSLLAANHIPYVIKTRNQNSSTVFGSGRGHTGTFGQNMNFAYEYKIYVHKDDYDRAVAIVNGRI